MTAVLPDGRVPVLLSAHTSDLLVADAAALLRYLDRRPSVAEVAATLLRTRRVRRHRAVVRARDSAELAEALAAVVAGAEHPLVAQSAETATPGLAFVFPGQGGQWAGMGAAAYRELPIYRAEADRCAAAFKAAGFASPLAELVDDDHAGSQVELQGAQFVHSVALAKVWQSYGFAPDFAVGHSLGEVGAAYVAGAMTLTAAVAVVAARAATMELLPGHYGVAVLGVTPAEAEDLIAAVPGLLELTVVNSRSSVAVSGDRDAVESIVARVTERGQFARQLAASSPFHTSLFDGLRDEFLARLPEAEFDDTAVQFIGSVTSSALGSSTDFARYWYANLRNTVRFDQACARVIGSGARAFVEMSAHPALQFAVGATADDLLPDGAAVVVGSGRRGSALPDELSASLVAAAVADPGYRWAQLVDVARRPLRDFPNAPMTATRIWSAPTLLPALAPAVEVVTEKWCETAVLAESTKKGRRSAVLNLGRATSALVSALDDVSPESADVLVVVAPDADEPDGVPAADRLAGLIEDGLLRYPDSIGALCRDVWLVTVRGEQVTDGEAAPLPAQAAIAAMHRCVGFEYPDVGFGHLDLPSGALDDATVTAAVNVLLSDTGEFALRSAAGRVTAYRRTLGASQAPAAPWPADGAVLDNVVISGGGGVIGLNYAAALAERGARRIVLLSRGGADPDAVEKLRTSHGVEVLSVRCDVTDAAQVHAVAADFGGDGASLVIHAAGAAGFATHDAITRAHFDELTAAKVRGLSHLTSTWPLRADARILLCSSVSATWGGKGMIVYSAANRMLDVMAARLRERGMRCTSIRWGLWEGSTLLGSGGTELVQRSGLRPMPPRPAIEISMADHPVDPLVLSADADRLRIFFGTTDDAAVQSDSAATPKPEPAGDVDSVVRVHLATVLSADPIALDLTMSLFDLGVDSLLAIDLRKRLKTATGQSVPLARLLGGITGTELVDAVTGAGADTLPTRPPTGGRDQKKVDVSRD